jgi:hypothetical protein
MWLNRNIGKILLIFPIGVFILSASASVVLADEAGTKMFSTWEGFEVDKCASIWLIKRFVDKEAIIRFYPKGELIDEGIPFDTPDAKFRRYHNMSTYESLLKHYKLGDPKLKYIGRIIHDIEVNVWERKKMEETLAVQSDIMGIIMDSEDKNVVVTKSLAYFDDLYVGLNK